MGGPGGEEGSALDPCHLNNLASAHVESPAGLVVRAFYKVAATPARRTGMGGPCRHQRQGGAGRLP